MDIRTIRSRTFDRLPLGLLGMLAIVASIETYVSRHSDDYNDHATASWRWSGQMISRHAGQAEILCLGDSLTKFAVQPRIIEARTGRTTYNFAINGGLVPISFFALRRAIDSGSRPAAIVFDTQDPPISREKLRSRYQFLGPLLHNRPQFLTSREVVDLAWSTGDIEFLGRSVISALLPSYVNRFEIRSKILAEIRGHTKDNSIVKYVHWRNWNINHGGDVQPHPPLYASV